MTRFILATVVTLYSSLLFARELDFFTEESPPFQVTYNNQNTDGISVKIVQLALKETPFTANIKVLPWARAVNQLEKKPDTFLFSMIRTKEREEKYIWVGKLFPIKFHLWTLKEHSHISINTLEDFKRHSIGALYKNIEHGYFQSIGLEDNLDLAYSPVKLAQKLFGKRIELIATNEYILKYLLEHEPSLQDYKFEDLKRLKTIEEISGNAYLVTSKHTSPEIITQLRAALEKARNSDEYKTILATRN